MRCENVCRYLFQCKKEKFSRHFQSHLAIDILIYCLAFIYLLIVWKFLKIGNPVRIKLNQRTNQLEFVMNHYTYNIALTSIYHTFLLTIVGRRVDSCHLNRRHEQHRENVVKIALKRASERASEIEQKTVHKENEMHVFLRCFFEKWIAERKIQTNKNTHTNT